MNDLYLLRSKLLYKSIEGVIEEFEIQDIQYVIIKGEPLSVLAYGRSGKRISSDIDILVTKSNLNKINKILNNNGFKQKKVSREEELITNLYSHQVLPYTKRISFVEVWIDINFDILWGEYEDKRIDVSEFIKNKFQMEIHNIKINTLKPLYALIQLILHHYKDMNSIYMLSTHNSIKSDMFKDIYYLIINNLEHVNVESLYNKCLEYDILKYAYYVLYYTNCIYDNEILSIYVDRLETESGKKILNNYGLSSDEIKVWRCDFKIRLNNNNIHYLIKQDLNEQDFKKIDVNHKIFG